jgi:hypothetical protein
MRATRLAAMSDIGRERARSCRFIATASVG